MTTALDLNDVNLDTAVERVAEFLQQAGLFFGHGSDSAEDEAVWLILAACGLAVDEEPDWEDKIHSSQSEAIIKLARRRAESRQPLAYLLGEAWFAGLPFVVDQRVLVPRSFFAEWIPDQFMPWVQPQRVRRILDLCCGSGCIGIAAAIAFPDAEVILGDISADALEVAALNVARYHLEDRVHLVRGNGLQRIDGKFDLILCNPPYVSSSSMESLPDEYRHEPALGLHAGSDGLDFIAPLLVNAGQFLSRDGLLFVETGSAGQAVQDAWPRIPFTWLGTEHDEMVLFMISREDLQSCQQLFLKPGSPLAGRTVFNQ